VCKLKSHLLLDEEALRQLMMTYVQEQQSGQDGTQRQTIYRMMPDIIKGVDIQMKCRVE
jgi:hypothetical protein